MLREGLFLLRPHSIPSPKNSDLRDEPGPRHTKRTLRERLHDSHTRTHQLQIRFLKFLKEVSGYRVVRIFRNYSAFSIVASSALLVSASNFTQGKSSNALLLGYIGNDAVASESAGAHRLAAQASKKDNLSLVPLADPSSAVDPEQKDDTTLFDVESLAMQNQVILSTESTDMAKDPEEEGGVKIYTVAEGDTLSSIAARNNITVNTILWANDVNNADEIKPGDQIFILPVAGLTHVVQSGDTIDSIAAKYKADKDKILSFNELPASGELKTGDSIVIPDGKKEEEPLKTPASDGGLDRRQYATSTGGAATDISGTKTLSGKGGTGHRFPYGYCTWYVAQKRHVPWGGNAGTWLYNAKALGYRTGKAPAVGAIVVTTENRYYGHVALVERVSGGTITVSEMNYNGWGKVDRRVLSTSSRVIKGYIY